MVVKVSRILSEKVLGYGSYSEEKMIYGKIMKEVR